jgi:hypothetical protein
MATQVKELMTLNKQAIKPGRIRFSKRRIRSDKGMEHKKFGKATIGREKL